MRLFSDSSTEEKYRELGFLPAGLSLRLTIGRVSIYATAHPLKGAILAFESSTGRSMCLYEVCLPERCGTEQIAGIIYVNILQNFQDSAEACRTYFQMMRIPLFQ